MKASFPPYTTQAVTDAKPSPPHEVSPVEAKLRTAMQYLYHARLLMDEVIALQPDSASFARDDQATGV